jgi:regulator of protease activity HflC (stomatin/prohibitin superfamily)
MGKTGKGIAVGIFIVIIAIIGIITYNLVTVNIRAGYVGYRYDRRVANGSEGTIPGTSVIDTQLTGLVFINPFTQEIITYPTTIESYNFTSPDENDNDGEDWSMTVGTNEGKNVGVDLYISVKPSDISKIIASFGTKSFDNIIKNDVYGLAKGKLSVVMQDYSVYDVQSSRSAIQEAAAALLKDSLEETYGISLVRFEIGTLTLPSDIQEKIDQKTEAINAVELAKLERQRQDEVNQQVVDAQSAESEKDLIARQTEADAAAYEKTAASEAELAVAENNVKIAEQKVKVAELEKEAELESQKAYTDEYFRNKELDVQQAAAEAINSSVSTIITDSDGSGYGGLVGLQKVLEALDEE